MVLRLYSMACGELLGDENAENLTALPDTLNLPKPMELPRLEVPECAYIVSGTAELSCRTLRRVGITVAGDGRGYIYS